MNVAYCVRIFCWIFLVFFFRAMKLAYFVSETYWGLTNVGEMYKGNSCAVQRVSVGNLVTL